MDLAFNIFEVASVALAVAVATSVVRDAESHWLEGAFLLLVYGMLGGGVLLLLIRSPQGERDATHSGDRGLTSFVANRILPLHLGRMPRLVKISAILFAPDDAAPPATLFDWLASQAETVLSHPRFRRADGDVAARQAARRRLRLARRPDARALAACRRLKQRLLYRSRPVPAVCSDDDACFAAALSTPVPTRWCESISPTGADHSPGRDAPALGS